MIALIVRSHVQVASTPAFLSKCTNAFSASSFVGKPLIGMTGSSGEPGFAGRIELEEIGSPLARGRAGRGELGPGLCPFRLPVMKLGARMALNLQVSFQFKT